TAQPAAPRSRAARPTTSSTAGVRRTPCRSSRTTGGASTNASRTARAKGIRTLWPQERPATTRAALPRTKKDRRAVVAAGASGMVPSRPGRGLLLHQGVDLRQQARELDRLGVVVVAAGLQRLLPVARHRVGGQGDDRDTPRGRRGLELPGGLPAVEH